MSIAPDCILMYHIGYRVRIFFDKLPQQPYWCCIRLITSKNNSYILIDAWVRDHSSLSTIESGKSMFAKRLDVDPEIDPSKLSGDANNDMRWGKRGLVSLDMVEGALKVVALIKLN